MIFVKDLCGPFFQLQEGVLMRRNTMHSSMWSLEMKVRPAPQVALAIHCGGTIPKKLREDYNFSDKTMFIAATIPCNHSFVNFVINSPATFFLICKRCFISFGQSAFYGGLRNQFQTLALLCSGARFSNVPKLNSLISSIRTFQALKLGSYFAFPYI